MEDIRALVTESLSVEMPELGAELPLAELTSGQKQTLRAAYGIILKHRAVLLYEKTGTGKTYVASALAAILKYQCCADCVVVAPAHLLDNWRTVLARFHVSADLYSYQAASLGSIPDTGAWNQTWIFDEAHFLKNASTKRWQNLFPLSARQRVCLVTATPLSLGWRDLYALMVFCGFPLDPRMMCAQYVYAFAYAVMPQSRTDRLELDEMPAISRTQIGYGYDREAEISRCISELSSCAWLTCTREQRVERVPILTDVLLHRMHSHRTACLCSLRRLLKYYRACRHDPHRRLLSRAEFAQMLGAEGVQMYLPFEEMLFGCASEDQDRQTMETDHQCLERCIRALEAICQQRDEKLEAVVAFVRSVPQSEKIVLFTQYRDTAVYFERALRGFERCALMTSKEALYKGLSVSPEVLYAMFGPVRMPEWWMRLNRPDARLLICTDAFACGQNFQRASTLIHLDLPWNPTVLTQREGRIIRKGQCARHVQIAECRLNANDTAVGAFENALANRLSGRRELQDSWLSDYAKVPQVEMLLYVSGSAWPNFWGKFGQSWLPMAPDLCLGMRISHVENVHFSSVIDDNLVWYRKHLRDLWHAAKNRKDVGAYRSFYEKLSFLRKCACYPQLEAVFEKCGMQDCPEISVPNANTRCLRIQIYPESMPRNAQNIHKLSTG